MPWRLLVPTFPAFVSGDRKWIVLHLFIDIAFHLWWPGQYSWRKCHTAGVFQFFSSAQLAPPMLLFFYLYSVCIYCKNFIKCLFFMRLHEKPEQGLSDYAYSARLVLLSSSTLLNILQYEAYSRLKWKYNWTLGSINIGKRLFFIVILPRGTTIMDLKWSNHKMIEV